MIAHIDVDAFFASILVRQDPRLQGKSLLALGMGGGCVIAASYEAKAKGIKTGMRLTEARKLCPEAVERISDFSEACRASAHIEEILERECPVMEKMSVDEWFLDLRSLVGGMPKDPGTWAKEIQTMIQQHLALSVSVGVGPTKTLAKMASEYRKPAGITIVADCQFLVAEYSQLATRNQQHFIRVELFLRDRPAAAIPGIGHARTKHTEHHGWTTAWDFAHAPTDTVVRLFGKPGKELQQELQGESVYPVQIDNRPPKSISRCRSFRKTDNKTAVYAQLQEHMSITVQRMRKERTACRWISVWMRDQHYHSAEAHQSLPRLMNTEEELIPYMRRCFDMLWKKRPFVTQIGLGLCRLSAEENLQYSLFETPKKTHKRESVQKALDAIHTCFGRKATMRGSGAIHVQRAKARTTLYGDTV